MKKYIIGISAALIMVFGAYTAYGAEDSLDIEKVAIKAIQYSTEVKAKASAADLTLDRYGKDLHVTNAWSASSVIYAPLNAQYQIDLSHGDLQITESSVRLSAYQHYITMLKNKYKVELQQKFVDKLTIENEDAENKLKSGGISEYDAGMIAANLAKERITLKKYQRSYDADVINLNKVMGEPVLNKYANFIDQNIKPSATLRPLEDYIQAGLVSRYEVTSAESSLEVTKVRQAIEAPDKSQSMPLDYYQATTQYDLAQGQNEIAKARIQVELDLTSGYSELESRLRTWENTKILLESAQSDYDLVKQNYDLGIAGKGELITAEKDYMEAQIQVKNAELDAWLFQMKMELASGIGPGISQ